MEKEFVPYELVVKLKALGFDEECFGYYHVNVGYTKGYAFCYFDKPKRFKDGFDLLAPTFSQAFRWFREKNYYVTITPYINFKSKPFEIVIEFVHQTGSMDYIDFEGESEFDTYEEAELACLTKLIEIVETRTK